MLLTVGCRFSASAGWTPLFILLVSFASISPVFADDPTPDEARQILGVEPKVSKRDLKLRYYELLRETHPSYNQNGDSREAEAKRINVAYNVLAKIQDALSEEIPEILKPLFDELESMDSGAVANFAKGRLAGLLFHKPQMLCEILLYAANSELGGLYDKFSNFRWHLITGPELYGLVRNPQVSQIPQIPFLKIFFAEVAKCGELFRCQNGVEALTYLLTGKAHTAGGEALPVRLSPELENAIIELLPRMGQFADNPGSRIIEETINHFSVEAQLRVIDIVDNPALDENVKWGFLSGLSPIVLQNPDARVLAHMRSARGNPEFSEQVRRWWSQYPKSSRCSADLVIRSARDGASDLHN